MILIDTNILARHFKISNTVYNYNNMAEKR